MLHALLHVPRPDHPTSMSPNFSAELQCSSVRRCALSHVCHVMLWKHDQLAGHRAVKAFKYFSCLRRLDNLRTDDDDDFPGLDDANWEAVGAKQ